MCVSVRDKLCLDLLYWQRRLTKGDGPNTLLTSRGKEINYMEKSAPIKTAMWILPFSENGEREYLILTLEAEENKEMEERCKYRFIEICMS